MTSTIWVFPGTEIFATLMMFDFGHVITSGITIALGIISHVHIVYRIAKAQPSVLLDADPMITSAIAGMVLEAEFPAYNRDLPPGNWITNDECVTGPWHSIYGRGWGLGTYVV